MRLPMLTIPAYRDAFPPLFVCLLVLAVTGPAHALDAAELAECRAIEAAAERLLCYDRLVDESRTPEARAARFGAETLPKPKPKPDPAPTVEPPADPAPESVPETVAVEDPDEIHSKIAGRFEGWTRGTRLKLENGQVWEVIGSRRVYHVAEAPEVSIRHSWSGAYWLKVDGLNHRAKVRRVK